MNNRTSNIFGSPSRMMTQSAPLVELTPTQLFLKIPTYDLSAISAPALGSAESWLISPQVLASESGSFYSSDNSEECGTPSPFFNLKEAREDEYVDALFRTGKATQLFIERFTDSVKGLNKSTEALDKSYKLIFTLPDFYGSSFYKQNGNVGSPIVTYLKDLISILKLDIVDLIHVVTYIDRYFLYYNQISSEKNFLNELNIHNMLLTASLITHKYLHDNHYTNAFVASAFNVPLEQINTMEIEFLMQINFDLNIEFNDKRIEEYFVALEAGESDNILIKTTVVGGYFLDLMNKGLDSIIPFIYHSSPTQEISADKSSSNEVEKLIIESESVSPSSETSADILVNNNLTSTEQASKVLTPPSSSSSSSSIASLGLFSSKPSESLFTTNDEEEPYNSEFMSPL